MGTELPTRCLGHTDVCVTVLGLGTAPLGGFRGTVPASEAMATVQAAWAAGVRSFDTAPFYGYGRSELLLGALLHERPRSEFAVFTKVGRVLRRRDPARPDPARRSGGLPFDADFDYGYDGVMRSVEQSMLRTGLDRFDVLLVHDLDTVMHPPAAFEEYARQARTGAFRALASLREQGVTSAIGVGCNEAPSCARWLREFDLDCALLAGRLTLLDQSACDEVVPLCRARGVALVAAGPFNSGILASRPAVGALYQYGQAPAAVVQRAQDWQALADTHGVSLQAAAMQVALQAPEVVSVLPGARSAAEVREIDTWFHAPVHADFWAAAEARGWLPLRHC